jgi:hypothetical protein
MLASARSALSGFVPRILADDPRDALTLHDLAVLATHLDRRSYLHRFFLISTTDFTSIT